ncbi:MAG: deoxynucleoside kinase [Betaproteobacteria bacterium]|nr:MAG: deoxynucleoside kinase [Betaproteobacteria bacterium]TAG47607.1 MAG: deoxynucleoside kinase [Betaproteobacteria bacterium]
MDLNQLRYVVIEGAIGSGKTSLARLLANRFRAETILEAPNDNPFIERFYADRPRYALATQINFLFQRADQLRPIAQAGLFSQRVISDFLLDKDALFARLNLSDDELSLYEKIYAFLKPQAPAPDLVIVLSASIDKLLTRVQQRGISYEQGIDETYLARLSDAYVRYFHDYDGAPVLFVNTDGINFVNDPAHLDLLIDRINRMRGRRESFSMTTA